MKKVTKHSFIVIVMILMSSITMPIMVSAQGGGGGGGEIGKQEMIGMYRGFTGGFGAMFSGLGYGGAIVGKVFETLLMQGLNFEEHEVLDNVFVLSADNETTIRGSFRPRPEVYFLPSAYDTTGLNGFPYCVVVYDGEFEYEITFGTGVTLLLWDNDRSFINAISRVINFLNKMLAYEGREGEIPDELVEEGVSVITWFLIHINDIFTGDELFVMNPITWQNLHISAAQNFDVYKVWLQSGDNYRIDLEEQNRDAFVPGEKLYEWYLQALETHDSRMQWLLTATPAIEVAETIYTQFSFDLIQLWMKNFEIHIDVGKLLEMVSQQAQFNMAEVFSGCDIDFFLFTHHLAGAFLYDDLDDSGDVSVTYKDVLDDEGNPVIVDNKTAQVPDTMEITHQLILGTVENFQFNKPQIYDDKRVSWGITLENAQISPVPVGVDLNSYLKTYKDELDYIDFGFTFEPKISEAIEADDGTKYQVASGKVKLDQRFAPWNDGAGPNSDITGLDMTVVYVSSVLHFHLNVETIGQNVEDPEAYLDPQQDYSRADAELSVGNYLNPEIGNRLDFVDIAGPYYELGPDAGSLTEYDASTSVIPVALWEGDAEAHKTFLGDTGTTADDFAADIRVTTDYNVMVYAVCYPEFNGSGYMINHDPTFSVFMVFTPQGFWALILLVAGVSLVAIGTYLIKRRKDRSL